MFDRIRQTKKFFEFRSKFKKIEREFEQITHTEEGNNAKVTVNGLQKVVRIEIDGVERPEIKDLINRANQNVTEKVAKKRLESGENPLDFLKGL